MGNGVSLRCSHWLRTAITAVQFHLIRVLDEDAMPPPLAGRRILLIAEVEVIRPQVFGWILRSFLMLVRIHVILVCPFSTE